MNNSIETRGRTPFSVVDLLALWCMYFFSYCTAEFLSASVFKLVGYGGVALFVLLAAWYDARYIRRFWKMSWPLVLFFAVVTGGSMLGAQVKGISNYSRNLLYMIIYMALFAHLIRPEKARVRKYAVGIWLLDSAVVNVYSIYRLRGFPMLSRYMSTGSVEKYVGHAVDVRAVITFGGVYGLTILVSVMAYLLLTKGFGKRIEKKWLMLGYVALALVTLLFAQFTIALLLVLIGIMLAVWVLPASQRRTRDKYVVAVAAGAFLLVALEPLLGMIVNMEIFPETINVRLEEIRALLAGDGSKGTDLGSRLGLYLQSATTFIETHGLGVLIMGTGTVGGHSELLDGLGNYGVLFLLMVIFYIRIYRHQLACVPEKNKNGVKLLFLVFLAEAVLNTACWARQTQIVLLIAPLMLMQSCGAECSEKQAA